jgi:hypothetical protein
MRIEEIRSGLVARLRARRGEIEEATMTRVYAVSERTETQDPEYAHGLRAAVSAALDYGFDALERSEDRAPPIPAVLLAQARLAARSGVSLDTVLRRYLAGYTLLGDFVFQEAKETGQLRSPALQRLLRAQAALLDRLLAAVSEEYCREEQERLGSAEERRADRVRRLLAGELIDISELAYEFDAWHVGAIASGPDAAEALRELARLLDTRLLLIRREEGSVWAWLGARRGLDAVELQGIASRDWPADISLALGDPAQGLTGWRLTHQQAKAALPIALGSSASVVRYADVALVASMLRDDLLVTSLRERFLAPLEQERDGGAIARATLRAYFAAERNVSSAAAALGVNRQTISNRLRAIEERLGCSLSASTTEVEAALRLQDIGHPLLPHAALQS